MVAQFYAPRQVRGVQNLAIFRWIPRTSRGTYLAIRVDDEPIGLFLLFGWLLWVYTRINDLTRKKMIKLFQFQNAQEVLNFSPFCMKIELYLKVCGLPYQVVYVQNPASAPKGKLPYIEDNGQKVADSDLIIEHLNKQYPDNSLDDWLTEKDKAVGRLIQRTFDEHLYWVLIYSRWCEEEAWPIIKRKFFGNMPVFIKPFVANMVRKKMIRSVNYQGLAKHSGEEIYQMGLADIKSVELLLANSSFLFGDKPSSFDVDVYAFLANFMVSPTQNPIKTYLQQSKQLTAYCHRMAAFNK